jgi:hypothetical protein
MLGGAQSQSGCGGEKTNNSSVPLPETNPRRLAHSFVTVLTEIQNFIPRIQNFMDHIRTETVKFNFRRILQMLAHFLASFLIIISIKACSSSLFHLTT